jgi:hypothetical protein
MQGKDLKIALSGITQETMTDGTMGDLWDKLPDYVAGSAWVGEILDMAQRASDWISDEDNYTDTATDISIHLADGEIEDYYSNINKRVQDLSLWARPELDSEVQEWFCGEVNPSLTDLNSHYLFCAMYRLAYAILEYASEKAEELETAGE